MLCHNNLYGFYKMMFVLIQQENFNFTLGDLENLMPFERDIYADLLQVHLAEKAEERRRAS